MKNKIWLIAVAVLVTFGLIYTISIFGSVKKIVDSNDTVSMSFETNPADSIILSDSLRKAIVQTAVYYNKRYDVSQYVLINGDELILVKYGSTTDFEKEYQISKNLPAVEKAGIVYSRYDFHTGSLLKETGSDNKHYKYIQLSGMRDYTEMKRTKDTLFFECHTSGLNFSNILSDPSFKLGFQVTSKRSPKSQFLLVNYKQATRLFMYFQDQKNAGSIPSFLRSEK